MVLGGLFTSTLSWALPAELAVGRVNRARKPSERDFDPTLLTRDPGLSLPEWFRSDGREACLRTLALVGAAAREWTPLLAVFEVVDCFPDMPEVACVVRVGDLDVLAPLDDKLGPAIETGRRAGRLGDLNRVLPVIGEAGWLLETVDLVVRRGGVEERVVGTVALVVELKAVRLGLWVGPLTDSLLAGFAVVAGLLGRAVLVTFELLELTGEVGERELAVDFELAVDSGFDTGFLVVFTFAGRFVAVFKAGTGFWYDPSGAAAAVVFDSGLASALEGDDAFSVSGSGGVFSLAETFCLTFSSEVSFGEEITFAICSTAFCENSNRLAGGEEPKLLLLASTSSAEPLLLSPQLVTLFKFVTVLN